MDQIVQDSFDYTEWKFATDDVLQREQIFPNRLAYNESSSTLALILKRSGRGDFALSEGGLNYLLNHETLKDGSPVLAAIVVLVDFDDQRRIKVFKQFSAEEMRKRFNGVKPQQGDFGRYWWILASTCDDEKF